MKTTPGTSVRTPDGVGYVVGRHKRRGVLYASVRLANGAVYVYRVDAIEEA
jgi:hypothetical protein